MGCKSIIRLAISFIATVEVGGLQRFAEEPTYTEVNPGEDALLRCRISNKRGICSWQKDNKGPAITWSQTNTSEIDQPRLWAARSILEMSPTRDAHRKQLACRAHHPSYPAPYYKDAYIMFDVKFIPVVSIVGAESAGLSILEEGFSSLTLYCKGNGNPKPTVWWTKNGQKIDADGPNLIIVSVTRNDSGIYGCRAKNSMGTSNAVKIEIDVKFPPRITWVGPRYLVHANLHSQVNLECKADGNPTPSYQWYHCPKSLATNNIPSDGYLISSASKLQLFNVTYNQRGKYVCIAKNYIGGAERVHKSKAVTLIVFGPPVGFGVGTAHGWRGSNANVQATICADPPPRTAYWFWGRFRLDVPAEIDRHKAFEKEEIDGCYLYTLSIRDVQPADSGDYLLHVGNVKGFSSHKIYFIVHETAHVAPLIAATLAIGALLLVLLCLIVRFRRKRDTVDYKITKFDRYAKVLHATTACSHRSPVMHIATLQTKPEQATEENFYSSPIALQTRHPRVPLQPSV